MLYFHHDEQLGEINMNSEESLHDETTPIFGKIRKRFQRKIRRSEKFVIHNIFVWAGFGGIACLSTLLSEHTLGALHPIAITGISIFSVLILEFGTLFTTLRFLDSGGYRLSKDSLAALLYYMFVFYASIPLFFSMEYVNNDPVFITFLQLAVPLSLLIPSLPIDKNPE